MNKLKQLSVFTLFLFYTLNCISQINIEGRVVDENNNPISNANIYLKIKNIGATTDLDGNFLLELSEQSEIRKDSIVFMHLNYVNKTLAYKDIIKDSCIVLKQDYHKLNEVEVYAQYAQNTYKLALANAKDKGKPTLLFFTASWCGICKYYKRLFTEENEISEYLKENYVLVVCDILTETGMKLKRLYNIGSGLPKFVVISPDERTIAKFPGGWKNDEECLKFLKQHSELPEKLESYKQIRQTSYDFSSKELRKRPIVTFDQNIKSTNWRILLNLGLINITNIESSNNSFDSHKIGYDFGLYAYYNKKGSNFSFQNGLLFSSQGGRSSKESSNFRINYLELPIRLNYQLYKGSQVGCNILKVSVAPYIAYGLTAKNKLTNERIKFGSTENQLKRWDYGVIPGLTISPIGNLEIFTGYKFGINNIRNLKSEKMYNRGLYFRMSVKFFGKDTYK